MKATKNKIKHKQNEMLECNKAVALTRILLLAWLAESAYGYGLLH